MNANKLLRDRDFSFVICRNIETYARNHSFFAEWRSAQSAIIELGKKCLEFDRNGLNIYWATEPVESTKCRDLKGLAEVFQRKNPPMMDNLIGAIREVITYYFSRRGWRANINGEIIITLLDHIPPESEQIVELLLETSHRLGEEKDHETNYELGMTFLQIGDNGATREFLAFLDNQIVELGGKDLVDAKHWRVMQKMSLVDLLKDALLD
ncbi:MAG: hypothetical protein ACK421_10495 [Pseudanabaenaceae cyanobacterium]